MYFWHFLTYHRKSPYHGKNIRTISWFFMIWHRNIAWNKPMVITVSWAISFCFLISWETLNLTLSLILWNLWNLHCIPRHETLFYYKLRWEKVQLQSYSRIMAISPGIYIRGIFCWNITNHWLRNSHQTWASILWENHRRNWEIFQQALLDYQRVKLRS